MTSRTMSRAAHGCVPRTLTMPCVSASRRSSNVPSKRDASSIEIRKALAALKFEGPVGRQVVLTGGGAELKGIAEYAQGLLGRAVRIGRPKGLIGLPDAHAGMSFTTLAGLALYAASEPIDLRSPPAGGTIGVPSPRGIVQRLIQAVRSGY